MIKEGRRGKGLWIFNRSLLSNTKFVCHMKNHVSLLHHKLSIHFSVPAAKKRNQNISKCKRNLHYINDQQLKHIRTKSKCNWHEDGKKYSKFFLNL